MRIVMTGATGNVGTSVLPALDADPAVDSMLGLARRLPERSWAKADFAAVDLGDPDADLTVHLKGADSVIHLAWAIQPARDEQAMWHTNVEGTAALLPAAANVSWRLRLQPTDPGWVDLVFSAPLMDTTRVRQELGWNPRHAAADAVTDILDGFRDRAGLDTAPLQPAD